ncbi:MAG: alpha-L-fucosidase [Verrucomicrobiota bacterium]
MDQNRNIIIALFSVVVMQLTSGSLMAADKEAEGLKTEPISQGATATGGNDPARCEWFKDQALGMFIHWSIDCPLGSVISHHLVGSSQEYQDRFFSQMPGIFYPKDFDPRSWARLAKLAGMKYVVFTTKHHAGFCMWDSRTTDFNIMHTPYGKDITRELFDAFRAEGIRVGVYFSPDDFWILHKQGHPITRTRPEANPKNNPELMQHNLAQVRELLTGYGKIDFIFFDGEPDQLKQLAWKIDPSILVTRGEIKTPEQKLPGLPMPGPWEANFTMGTEWPFKPTNEEYKSGTELIKMLLEVRAKGGNLLLNIGPDPDGVIPFEQTRRLRELALWMFVNGEAIYNIRPWIVVNEGSVWFTQAKDTNTVYAFETNVPWEWATWREFTLKSVRATEDTEVEVVGQTGDNRCWSTEGCKASWHQEADGLHLRAMFAQRLYTDCKWPNPIVIRITHAQPVPEDVPAILKAQQEEQRLYQPKKTK